MTVTDSFRRPITRSESKLSKINEEEDNNAKSFVNTTEPAIFAKRDQSLTLTIVSTSSDFLVSLNWLLIKLQVRGMEIRINPKGLDENYPFLMTQEHADRWYNIRKAQDGYVYFGIDHTSLLSPEECLSSKYMPSIKNSESTYSNRYEKILMYFSHTSSWTDLDAKTLSNKSSRYFHS